MKRGLSDSDSDGDDLLEDSLTAGSPSQSCQISDRKRRRGVIEKRRRDRINSSLSELRRLVPSAFEKQGSAKLEKAEILQMTVDHLKLLQHKGLNSYSCDPSSLAKDYRHMGFTECATEVARYLVAVEGLDLQDPLRMRLLTHLHGFANREGAAVKAAAFQHSSSVWSSPAPSLHPQYNPIMPSAHPGTGSFSSGQAAFGSLRSGQAGSGSLGSGAFGVGTLPPQSGTAEVMSSTSASSLMTAFSDLRGCVGNGDAGSGAGCGAGMGGVPALQGSAGMVPTSSGRSVPTSSLSPPLLHSLGQLHSHTPTSPFPGAGQSLGMPPSSHHPSYPQPHSTTMQMPSLGVGLQQVNSVKPYRPWGGELAY